MCDDISGWLAEKGSDMRATMESEVQYRGGLEKKVLESRAERLVFIKIDGSATRKVGVRAGGRHGVRRKTRHTRTGGMNEVIIRKARRADEMKRVGSYSRAQRGRRGDEERWD